MNRKLFFLFLFIPCFLKAASAGETYQGLPLYIDYFLNSPLDNELTNFYDKNKFNLLDFDSNEIEPTNTVPQIAPIPVDDEIGFVSPSESAHFCGALTFNNLTPTTDKERFKQLQKKQKSPKSPAKKAYYKKRQPRNSERPTYLICPFPDCNVQCTRNKGMTLFAHLLKQHNLQDLLNKAPKDATIEMKHGTVVCVKCCYAARSASTFYAHKNSVKHLSNNK